MSFLFDSFTTSAKFMDIFEEYHLQRKTVTTVRGFRASLTTAKNACVTFKFASVFISS